MQDIQDEITLQYIKSLRNFLQDLIDSKNLKCKPEDLVLVVNKDKSSNVFYETTFLGTLSAPRIEQTSLPNEEIRVEVYCEWL
jgi:hypothetical protein